MTGSIHEVHFPGESDAYRTARNELLEAELALRSRIEEVAALRRRLPPGGPLKEDYIFDELRGETPDPAAPSQTRLSELFEPGHRSLVIYSFMFDPDWAQPCPMCSCLLDSLDRTAMHATQRVSFAVVAKAPIDRVHAVGVQRGWAHLRLLSSLDNTYNADYHGENARGQQIPTCNVFTKASQGITHFYSTEILFSPVDGQPRHMDMLWPLWNLFDLTPEGRGTNWMPSLEYDAVSV